MGIMHFAPVGASPGAVTSALAYLRQYPNLISEDQGDIIESIVIFCSTDVYSGSRPTEPYIWNTYGRSASRQGWQEPRYKENVIEVIKNFLTHPPKHPLLPPKGELYVWPVDVNDYEACFKAIARATLAKGRSDDTGKHIWGNLTGGTNILNSALMQVASLSGLIGRLYYTFIAKDAYRKYLQPPTLAADQYAFEFIPLAKTIYDLDYYRILEVLYDKDWMEGRELLSHLKQLWPHTFDRADFDFAHFKNQYLNRMAGDVLIEKKGQRGEYDRPVKINQTGRDLLERLHLNRLVEALINRDIANPDLVQVCQAEMQQYQVKEWTGG